MHADDDMRGQRFDERTFEKGDHRAEDTSGVGSAKAKVRQEFSRAAGAASILVWVLLAGASFPPRV